MANAFFAPGLPGLVVRPVFVAATALKTAIKRDPRRKALIARLRSWARRDRTRDRLAIDQGGEAL